MIVLFPTSTVQGKLFFFLSTTTTTATTKSLQSCLTLCDPIDGSPPGSPVPGFLQTRTLEWVAISFSNAWRSKGKVKSLSRVRLFATPWTAAHQAPPSMGFSRQEYWSGVPSPSPHCTSNVPLFSRMWLVIWGLWSIPRDFFLSKHLWLWLIIFSEDYDSSISQPPCFSVNKT